jgi:hypothetical protein
MTMKPTIALTLALGSLTLAATALADASDFDRKRAGTKGHITAYEQDGTTIIDVDSCPSGYAACGSGFRERIKDQLCRKLGSGTHAWYYQIGDARTKIASTAFCKGEGKTEARATAPAAGSTAPSEPARAPSGGSYDVRHAGTKSYVTAYEADGVTIIDVDHCPNGYVACGAAFREKIKDLVCGKHGPGKHTWRYQLGESSVKSANTAICK